MEYVFYLFLKKFGIHSEVTGIDFLEHENFPSKAEELCTILARNCLVSYFYAFVTWSF